MCTLSDSGTGMLIKLNDWIRYYKGKSITYYKGYMDVDLETHISDVFDNFWQEKNYRELNLSDEEKIYFQYNPKGLAQSLYGSHDLWWVILKANDLDHPGQMELEESIIKVPSLEALEEYLSLIYQEKTILLDDSGELW